MILISNTYKISTNNKIDLLLFIKSNILWDFLFYGNFIIDKYTLGKKIKIKLYYFDFNKILL
jgi:hypothetical protein